MIRESSIPHLQFYFPLHCTDLLSLEILKNKSKWTCLIWACFCRVMKYCWKMVQSVYRDLIFWNWEWPSYDPTWYCECGGVSGRNMCWDAWELDPLSACVQRGVLFIVRWMLNSGCFQTILTAMFCFRWDSLMVHVSESVYFDKLFFGARWEENKSLHPRVRRHFLIDRLCSLKNDCVMIVI